MSNAPEVSQEEIVRARRPFDPADRNCLARFINRTDEQVDSLILSFSHNLDRQGEYDQGDKVLVDFDEARDVATVADLFWAHRPSVDVEQGDSEDRISRDRRLLAEAASLLMAIDTVGAPHGTHVARGEGAGDTRDVSIPDGWFDQSNALLAEIRDGEVTPDA